MKATSPTALAILALLLLIGCSKTTESGTSQQGDTKGGGSLNHENFGKIFNTIRTQGVMELSEVEHILGGAGAVVPDPPWGDPFTEFRTFAEGLNDRYHDTRQKFRKQVPMKLSPGPVRDKNGMDVVMVVEAGAGEAGEVPRWFRWMHGDRSFAAGVLGTKVFWIGGRIPNSQGV